MDQLCIFLMNYYSDNGITDKKTLSIFRCMKKNNRTTEQNVDYIINKLQTKIKTCLKEIEVIKTPKKTSVLLLIFIYVFKYIFPVFIFYFLFFIFHFSLVSSSIKSNTFNLL